MEPKKGNDEVVAVLALLAIGIGGLAYWWWKQGDERRMALLWPIAHSGGYGPIPGDLLEQVGWLATHRLREMEGMVMAFLVSGVAGLIEGTAKRQSVALSGFGLRLFRSGRVVLLFWLAGLFLFALTPVALPYREVGGCLVFLLFGGTFTLARGIRRVQ